MFRVHTRRGNRCLSFSLPNCFRRIHYLISVTLRISFALHFTENVTSKRFFVVDGHDRPTQNSSDSAHVKFETSCRRRRMLSTQTDFYNYTVNVKNFIHFLCWIPGLCECLCGVRAINFLFIRAERFFYTLQQCCRVVSDHISLCWTHACAKQINNNF